MDPEDIDDEEEAEGWYGIDFDADDLPPSIPIVYPPIDLEVPF